MNFDVEAYEAIQSSVPQHRAMVEVERSRATQEVQAAMVIAKKFPRDTTAAFTRIMDACKRSSLAQTALYKFPRGGQNVTGASIRLAEVMAQAYGNLDFGIREIERMPGKSIAESYCWDLETNVKSTKIFEVAHIRDTKQGPKKLTDERDIYELVANMGARRLRACILAIIPADIREAAESQIQKTLSIGGGKPIEDKIRDMVIAFKDVGVTQEMIEKRLGHDISVTTGEEITDLFAVFNSLKDKQAKREDFFDFRDDEGVKPQRTLDTLFDDPKESVNTDSEPENLHRSTSISRRVESTTPITSSTLTSRRSPEPAANDNAAANRPQEAKRSGATAKPSLSERLTRSTTKAPEQPSLADRLSSTDEEHS